MEFIQKAFWFLRCGQEVKEDNGMPSYSDFSVDSDMVYDAFYNNGIDLDLNKDLHWWKFMSRMRELKECRLNRIMYLRKMYHEQGDKMSKHEKEECAIYGWDLIRLSKSIQNQALHEEEQRVRNKMKEFDEMRKRNRKQ
jgi:hypothetical protein